MNPLLMIALIWVACLPAANAADIYRCAGSGGEPKFSQQPCGGRIDLVTPGPANWIDGAAMKQRALEQLQRIKQLPSPTLPSRSKSPQAYLGYAQRARLRQLNIEAEGLRRDLDRAGPRRRQALQQELRQVGEHIRELQRGGAD